MDQDVKDFLTSNFQRLEEKIDMYNSAHTESIGRLKENDRQHFELDREHREHCSLNRAGIKSEIDDTLSRFGERIGSITIDSVTFQEKVNGKIIALENSSADIIKRIDKNNDAILARLDKTSDGIIDWVKLAFPYILILAYVVIKYAGGFDV